MENKESLVRRCVGDWTLEIGNEIFTSESIRESSVERNSSGEIIIKLQDIFVKSKLIIALQNACLNQQEFSLTESYNARDTNTGEDLEVEDRYDDMECEKIYLNCDTSDDVCVTNIIIKKVLKNA